MLAQRLRRWPNIETALGECPVFAGCLYGVIAHISRWLLSERPIDAARVYQDATLKSSRHSWLGAETLGISPAVSDPHPLCYTPCVTYTPLELPDILPWMLERASMDSSIRDSSHWPGRDCHHLSLFVCSVLPHATRIFDCVVCLKGHYTRNVTS